MNHVKINQEECKGCKLCVEVCPTHCLIIGMKINKTGYQYAEFKTSKCSACGICFHICPEPGAITVIEEGKKRNE